MRSVNGRGRDPTSHPRSSTRQGRHTPPAVSARAPGSTKPRRPWPTRWRRRCRAGCAPPGGSPCGARGHGHGPRTDGDRRRHRQRPVPHSGTRRCRHRGRGQRDRHRGGVVAHAWGAVNREVATRPGRPPHRLGLGAGGSVQSAVGCALSPSLRGVVARRRAGLDAGGQLLGAPNAAATTRQTRTAETRHDHAGGRGRAQGHRRRGPR
jgi:hypothetical protein